MNKSLVFACAVVLIVIIFASYLLYQYPLESLIDAAATGQFIASFGAPGMVVFFLAGALFTAFGLPRQLVAFIGGYTYGVLTGVVLGTFAAVVGAMLTFFFARWLARPYVARKFPRQVAAIDAFVRDKLFLKILTIRFLPFGTNLATNLASGATNVAVRPFVFASFIGFIPQMTIFALSGQGVSVGSSAQLSLAAGLFAISLAISLYIYRHRTQAEA